MPHPLARRFDLKQYSRFVLALFIVSVINMAIQLPVHAAMQQKMMSSEMSSMQMQEMTGKIMAHCKCPPAICESVASQSDKSVENLFSNSAHSMLGFRSTYSIYIGDSHHQLSTLQLFQHDWQFRQSSPPPLSLNTVLHI